MGYPHLSGPTPCACDGYPLRPVDLETGRFTDLFRVMKVPGGFLTHLQPCPARVSWREGGTLRVGEVPAGCSRSGSVGGLIASFAGRHAKRTLPRAHIGCL